MPILGKQCWIMLDHVGSCWIVWDRVFLFFLQISKCFLHLRSGDLRGGDLLGGDLRWGDRRLGKKLWVISDLICLEKWEHLKHQTFPNLFKLSKDQTKRISKNCSFADLDLGQVDPKEFHIQISSHFQLNHLASLPDSNLLQGSKLHSWNLPMAPLVIQP